MYLLDTNVVSETRRPSRHGAVMDWLASHSTSQIFIPSIVFLELQRGVELTRQQDPLRASAIELWIDLLAANSNIVNFDTAAAREYSRFARRKPAFVSEDVMIAAVARVNGYTIATRNVQDFQIYNVHLVNPFEYEK